MRQQIANSAALPLAEPILPVIPVQNRKIPLGTRLELQIASIGVSFRI
jgi:hypothetical protein